METNRPTDAVSVGEYVRAFGVPMVRLPERSISADAPLTSVAAAIIFARRFLIWCDSNDIAGPIDWPRLYNLSVSFALEENRRFFSEMALAKALTRLKVPKQTRVIEPGEIGLVSYRKSKARRPRVTQYILLPLDDRANSMPPQTDLFD